MSMPRFALPARGPAASRLLLAALLAAAAVAGVFSFGERADAQVTNANAEVYVALRDGSGAITPAAQGGFDVQGFFNNTTVTGIKVRLWLTTSAVTTTPTESSPDQRATYNDFTNITIRISETGDFATPLTGASWKLDNNNAIACTSETGSPAASCQLTPAQWRTASGDSSGTGTSPVRALDLKIDMPANFVGRKFSVVARKTGGTSTTSNTEFHTNVTDKSQVQFHFVPLDSGGNLLTPNDAGRYNTGTSTTIRIRAWIVTGPVSGTPTDAQLAEMRDVGYLRWELSSDGWQTPFLTYSDFPAWDHDNDANTADRNFPLQSGELSPWQQVGGNDNVCLSGFWTEAQPNPYRHIPASCNLNIGGWVELSGQKSLRDEKRWRTKLNSIDFDVTLPGAIRQTTPPAVTPLQFGITGWVNCSNEGWLGCYRTYAHNSTPKPTVKMGRLDPKPHVARHRSILFRNDPAAIDPATGRAYGYTDANRVDWNPGDPIPDEVTTPLVGRQYGERVCQRRDMDPGFSGYIGSATDECNRAVRVGEGVAISYVLQNGGDNSNDWWERPDPSSGTSFFATFDDWDEVELSAPAGAAAIVFGNLCPVTLGDGNVINVFGNANAPRDRTAAAMASCRYPSSIRWSAENFDYLGTATFVFPAKTGSLPLTVTYYKENDDPNTPAVEFDTLASDTITLTVVDAPADIAFKAELNQYNFENQLNLGIGYHWLTGVPAHWGVGETTLPGGRGMFGGATYADLAENDAIQFNVPSGTLTLLGGTDGTARPENYSCTGPCTLTLSRDDLKWSARYRLLASQTNMMDIEDTAPYFPASFEYRHAPGSTDVILTGVLKPANGRPNFNFSYVARRAAVDLTTKHYLLSDADGMLAPGESAALTAGFRYTNANDQYWSVLGTDQNFYQVVEYYNDGVPAAWTAYELVKGRDESTPDVFVPDGDSYLVINGPATWASTGGKRLRVGAGRDYDTLHCVRSDSLGGNDEPDGQTCYVINSTPTASAPRLPVITIDSDADEDVTITASLSREAGIWVMTGRRLRWGDSTPISGWAPPGTPSRIWREFIPLASFGTITIEVDAVKQLEAIALDRKPPGEGQPSPTGPVPIRPGKEELLLRLFNANGQSSQISAVSAITLSVSGGGSLSSPYGCTGGGASCSINLGTGAGNTADNSLALKAIGTPHVTRDIPITYSSPPAPGTATVRATVIGRDGAIFTADVELTISGSAARVTAGGDLPRVHSSATEGDDRDVIEIPITAEDDGGNEAPMPTNASAAVKGPDGAALPSGSHTSAVVCRMADNVDTRRGCKIRITITAPAAQPLASGAYTATLTGSGIGSTDVSFAVAGPAETVSIAIPDELPGLAQTFTATATVTDMGGSPVADGTWVTFNAMATGRGQASAIVTSPALSDHDENPDTADVRRRKTVNGEASASITIVGSAISVLRASVGDKSASQPIDTRGAVMPGTGENYNYNTPDGTAAIDAFAIRSSSAPVITADEALAEAPAGSRVVWLWNGVDWISYGETDDGTSVPGSRRFAIRPSDTVWFGGS